MNNFEFNNIVEKFINYNRSKIKSIKKNNTFISIRFKNKCGINFIYNNNKKILYTIDTYETFKQYMQKGEHLCGKIFT